jgi:multiple antibiotic resistance protein
MNLFDFIKTALLGSIALFPLIDPIGSSILSNPLLEGLTGAERAGAARQVAIYCLLICLVTMVAGTYVLQFFGLSIPVVQIGGGILMCRQSWQMLSVDLDVRASKETVLQNAAAAERSLFYPIAFPVMIGPETIAGLLTLSAHSANKDKAIFLMNLSALAVAIIIVCTLIYVCVARTPWLIHLLGEKGEKIVNQLSAFLFFCVGIQIAQTGLFRIVQEYLR